MDREGKRSGLKKQIQMNNYFLVFIGGGLGSLARYGVLILSNLLWVSRLPFATFISNTLSSLVLGFLVGLALEKYDINAGIKLFFITGFCGGFSTFSSFSFETLELMRSGQVFYALINIVVSIIVCLLCVWAGMVLAKLF